MLDVVRMPISNELVSRRPCKSKTFMRLKLCRNKISTLQHHEQAGCVCDAIHILTLVIIVRDSIGHFFNMCKVVEPAFLTDLAQNTLGHILAISNSP